MNLIHIAHLLSTAWAAAGELLTAGAILWALNALANAVRLTYSAGFTVGTFYRAHLHHHLKWAAVRLVALLITLAEYAWRAARWVWAHREEIREQIGSAFAYRYEPTSETKLLPPAAPVAPAINPMMLIAEELELLTRRQLNTLTGDHRKTSKRQLIAAYLAA